MPAQVHQLRPSLLRPFSPFNVSDRTDEPKPREWIVDAAVMRRTVCLLTGAPGLGKSLLLQQLCCSVSLGQPWLGREVIPARALGIFTEDDNDELQRRQRDMDNYYNVLPPDYEARMHWDTREGETTNLVEWEFGRPVKTDFWRALWGEENPHAFVWQNDIQVVVLDSATAVFGGNINNATQVQYFVRELHQQAIRMNGAVIINAHPNKADINSFGGSIQWIAACRAALGLRRPSDYDDETDTPADVRELWGLKANYHGRKSRDKLHYEAGVFVLDDPPPKRRLNDPLERLEMDNRLVMGLRRAIHNGARVPADVMAAGSLPRRAHQAKDIDGVSLNWLYDAQERLVRDGRIVRVNARGKCLIRPAEQKLYEGEEGLWME